MTDTPSTAPENATSQATETEPQPGVAAGSLLITGANGHLGARLIPALAAGRAIIALVRSASAALSLQTTVDALPRAQAKNVTITQLDYTDVSALQAAAQGCSEVIHLAGILKESPYSTYQQAHEDTTEALLAAVEGFNIERISYLSIVGSAPNASNACLASKGRAEAMLLEATHPALILQVPMVLGENDYAAQALNAQARKGLNIVFAANARDQPLYAGDVVNALTAAAALPADFNARLTLAGPETANKRQLINRAATLLNNSTRVIGLPGGLAIAMAKLLETVSKNPPVTRPMMEILHHDDHYDPEPACRTLGIHLTSLDDMLENVLLRA